MRRCGALPNREHLMPIPPSTFLRVFILNVGQADTSVIVTPRGNIILVDIVQPGKVYALLRELGSTDGEAIGSVIITHPHNDHYSGAPAIIRRFGVRQVLLAPYAVFTGTPGYHALVNQV